MKSTIIGIIVATVLLEILLIFVVIGGLIFAECHPTDKVAEKQNAVEKLEAREKRASQVVKNYETQRDALRDEVKKLTIEKKGLEDVGPTVTNIYMLHTNVYVVTNVISSFDATLDGRISDRRMIIEYFKTDEVFALPYSPHEFIVRTTNGIYYACMDKPVLTNVVSFRIFK